MSLGRSSSAASMLGPSKVIRRLDRPRPLKFGSTHRLSAVELSSVEDVVVMMENVSRQLNARNYDRHTVNCLLSLCATLKKSGPQLEHLYKDQLDKLGIAQRNACKDDQLDLVSRVHLLEIIELRAMNWQANENVTAFYKQKLAQLEYSGHLDLIPAGTPVVETPGICQTAPVMLNPTALDFSPVHSNMAGPLLGPGEVVSSSGRFGHPTKIPGKNYYKDEVVIRNADSGKVMGLKGRRVHMIEELTETIISFQRVVPGAKERLVQITGPAQDNILQAKGLIEDTIRRNQSPLPREEVEEEVENLCSGSGYDMNDSKRNTLVAEREVPIHEYKYTVNVGEECIRVTGASLDLIRTAKLVLDEYFSLTAENKLVPNSPDLKAKPVFSLGPKTAFSPVNVERQVSVTSPVKRSMFSKPTVSPSPLLSKSSSRSLTKPEITYDRAELLKLSMSDSSRKKPSYLGRILQENNHIERKSQSRKLNGLEHLELGLSVFTVEQYIKPYAGEEEE